ncbi:MAG TPA: glycogen-binding domain-containing protein [Kofleriaceae bacterium]|nr:glycogen-binding domain-containing protein [Kofleriaceae bacterium]
MFPSSAAFLLATLVACGGAPQNQSTTPAPTADPAAPATATTAPATPGPTAAPAAAAPAQPTRRGPNLTPDGVVFNFKPEGKPAKIFLAGNFNSWNPADPKYLLMQNGPDGLWTITVKLAPGTYQYKFVADGQWIKDPNSPGSAPDGFGGQNGQFDVK